MPTIGSYQRKVLEFLAKAWSENRGLECNAGRLIDLDDLAWDRKARERRLESLFQLEARGLIEGLKHEPTIGPKRTIFRLTQEGERVAEL